VLSAMAGIASARVDSGRVIRVSLPVAVRRNRLSLMFLNVKGGVAFAAGAGH
jgi:hypothetical protein